MVKRSAATQELRLKRIFIESVSIGYFFFRYNSIFGLKIVFILFLEMLRRNLKGKSIMGKEKMEFVAKKKFNKKRISINSTDSFQFEIKFVDKSQSSRCECKFPISSHKESRQNECNQQVRKVLLFFESKFIILSANKFN